MRSTITDSKTCGGGMAERYLLFTSDFLETVTNGH